MAHRPQQRLADLASMAISENSYLICASEAAGAAWLRDFPSPHPPHPITLWNWIAELAEPALVKLKLKFLAPVEQEALVSAIWHGIEPKLSPKSKAQLGNSPGIVRVLQHTIHELRLAEIDSTSFDPDLFPSKEKGRVLHKVLEQYEQALAKSKLADPATVITLVRDRLLADMDLPAFHLILPEELQFSGLLQSVLDQVPDDRKTMLPLPIVDSLPLLEESVSDICRLAWLREPLQAPPKREDSTVKLYRALSAEYEVRAVLGTLLHEKIPFDQAEVLYSDEAVYPQLFYSLLAATQMGESQALPLTFGSGVPVVWTRPGRAMQFWLSWIDSDYRYDDLAELLIQNLLILPEGVTADALLYVLKQHPGCTGQEAWRRHLAARHAEVEAGGERNVNWLALEELVETLFSLLPKSPNGTSAWKAAEQFLTRHVRILDPWDEQARTAALELIKALHCDKTASTDEVIERLNHWASEEHLPGEQPRPGALMLSPIARNESVHRPYTFCVGLSDESYPSIPARQSILTDRERKGLSPELERRMMREVLHQQEVAFITLLGQLQGKVVFTYSCADQIDDRERFPSQLFLRIFRLTAGLPEGDLHELESWLAAPLGPDSSQCRITRTEEWLDHWPARPFHDPLFKKDYPLLARGAYATGQRRSPLFTEHDGYVTGAGAEFDLQRSSHIFSAHALQLFARCPLQFYFQQVLKLEAFDVSQVPPGQWLSPLQRGNILHALFHQYHLLLLKEKRKPDRLHDGPLLRKMLDAELNKCDADLPVVASHVRDAEMRELHETLHIFLGEETLWADNYSPRYFETSIGMKEGEHTSKLDTPNSLVIRLPSGRSLHLQGRVDRIDEHQSAEQGASPQFFIWDYKTGKMREYNESNRRSGQLLQPYLYLEMVEKRLREVVNKDARVTGAGYFFPSQRGGQGDRLQWTAEQLREDAKVLDTLINLMQAGVFLATDQQDTCRTCSYRHACDVSSVNKQATNKLKYTQNAMLKPLWPLRRSSS